MLDYSSGLHEIFSAGLLSERMFPHQSSGKFRPSEASATIQTKYGPIVRGACKRKTWYRLSGTPAIEEPSLPHQIQRMNVGTQVERAIIESAKINGIYVANNIPFRAEMSGIQIAGELDAVFRTQPCGGQNYCAEVKSIYGYYAQKSVLGRGIGVGQDVGVPRDSYLMQLALYLNRFSRLPKDDPSYLPFGVIFVCDRGDGHFGVFDSWLEREIRILGEGEEIESHKIIYKSPALGVPRTVAPYTVEDILTGYRLVQRHLEIGTPPERDFVKEYNREQIEARYALGEVSKSAYDKWVASHSPRGKKKEVLGDWNCYPLYCPWSTLCWEGSK